MLWEESTHRRRLEDADTVRRRSGHRFNAVAEVVHFAYALCRRLGLTLGIFTTAAMYLHRYYCRAKHEVHGDDRSILTSVIYVAMKAHDAPTRLHGYLQRLSLVLENVDPSTAVAYELDVLESIQFDVMVHSPFRIVEVICKELADQDDEGDARMHIQPRVLQETIALLCAPPIQLTTAPQVIAVCAAAYAIETLYLADADAGRTLARRFCATPVVERVLSTEAGVAQVTALVASASLACAHFAVDENEGDVAGNGEEEEEKATGGNRRGHSDFHGISVALVAEVASYLPVTDIAALRVTCRRFHGPLGPVYWRAFHIEGQSEHPADAAGAQPLALHPGELRLLKCVGASLTHTGRAEVHRHAFSSTAVAALREMADAGTIVLTQCRPKTLG